MKRSAVLASLGVGVLLTLAGPARANYAVYVAEGSVGSPFAAANSSFGTVLGQSDSSLASFIYNGPLNFSSSGNGTGGNTDDLTSAFFGANAQYITAYGGNSPSTSVAYGANGANFSTLAGFLATSGSASDYAYGSLYLIYSNDVADYGGTVLTITHDDGLTVYANGVALTGTTSGPTGAVTETVRLPDGTTQYQIAYARENGAPSVLQVSVPEPMSMALLGTGLAGIGLVVRRRKASGLARPAGGTAPPGAVPPRLRSPAPP